MRRFYLNTGYTQHDFCHTIKTCLFYIHKALKKYISKHIQTTAMSFKDQSALTSKYMAASLGQTKGEKAEMNIRQLKQKQCETLQGCGIQATADKK